MKTIGEITKVGAGQSAPQDASAFSNDGTPFVRAGSLEFLCKGASLNKLERINEQQAKIHKLKLYPSGTILFAKSGMSAVQNRVFVLPKPAHVVSHLATVEVKNGVDSKFLSYFWQNFKTSNLIQDPAYPSISLEAVGNVEIELPSHDEQKRIAAILDKADRLRRQRRFAQTLSDSFLQSVFIKMFGDPVSNPMNWEECKVGDVVAYSEYGTSEKSNNEKRGCPILGMGNISYSGEIDLSSLSYVELTSKEYKKLKLEKDDIIFNRTNSTELVGKVASWNSKIDAAIASYLVKLKLKKNTLPNYFVRLLNTPHYKRIFRERCKKAVGQSNVSPTLLKEFPMIVPPLPLQEKFAEIVQKFERVRRQQREATRQAEHLFQTLLHRAFRGEL